MYGESGYKLVGNPVGALKTSSFTDRNTRRRSNMRKGHKHYDIYHLTRLKLFVQSSAKFEIWTRT